MLAEWQTSILKGSHRLANDQAFTGPAQVLCLDGLLDGSALLETVLVRTSACSASRCLPGRAICQAGAQETWSGSPPKMPPG